MHISRKESCVPIATLDIHSSQKRNPSPVGRLQSQEALGGVPIRVRTLPMTANHGLRNVDRRAPFFFGAPSAYVSLASVLKAKDLEAPVMP